MKITAIRFMNLNSLRGRFELDFTAAPFVDSGIFAVTGPTGAGKSTIFDALCLALYGETPRLRKRRTGGEGIFEIVSRHTTEGWAEVDFELPEGRFTSRWEAHRARGSVSGAFQQPRMRLTERKSGGDLLIEEKLKEVPERISSLSGLDFTRFTRSVLLAQGAFAAFLEAGSAERAELLEKMTGSVIYSEVSRLAYERAREEEAALRGLEERRDAITCLSEEERGAAEEKLGQAEKAYSGALDARDEAIARVEESKRSALRREELIRCRTRLEVADRRLPEIEASSRTLAAHERVRPYWSEIERLDYLAEESDREESAADEVRQRLATTGAKEEQLQQDVLRLEVASDEAGKALEEFSRRHREADKLQTALGVERDRLAEEDERLTRIAEQEGQSRQAKSRLVVRLDEIDRESRRIEDLIDESGRATLASQSERALLYIAELAAGRQSIARAREEEDGIHAALAKLPATSCRTEAEAPAGETSLQDMKLHNRTIEDKLALLPEASRLRQELKEAESRVAEFSALVPRARRIQELDGELSERQARSDTLNGELERERERLAGLGLTLEEYRAASAREAAVELRRGLKKGSPCPVCGATDHPLLEQGELAFADPHPVDDGSASPEDDYRAALLAVRSVEERIAAFEERSAELRAEKHGLEEELLAADYSEKELSARSESYEKLARELERRRTLEEERGALLAELETLREKEALFLDEQHRRGQEEAVLKERMRSVTAARVALETSAMQLRKGLEPLLDGTGIDPEAQDAAARVEAEVQTYRQRVEEKHSLAEERRSRTLQLEQRQEELESLAGEAARLGERRESITAAVEELESSLNGVIGERSFVEYEEYGAVCRRSAAQAEEELARVRGELARLREELAQLRGSLAAAEEGRARLRQRQEALKSELETTSVEEGFSDLAAFRGAYLEEGETLKQEVDRFYQELEAVKSRIGELTEALADQGDEPVGLEELIARKEGAETAFAEAQQGRYEAKSLLERDGEQRTLYQTLSRELEERRGEYAVWWRLRELIGSAKGDSFRRFAQGLTLDFLISLANRHLRRFSGRYRLKRSSGEELALQIVDTWQADSVRPVETLSGGETFLASLSLALGLSELAGRKTRIESLFLDEGFGSLDGETLETVIAALETLRSSGKLIGLISHVEALKERIPVQIRVQRRGTGYSSLAVVP